MHLGKLTTLNGGGVCVASRYCACEAGEPSFGYGGHVPRMFLEVLQNFSVNGQSIVAPDVNGSRKDTCPPLSRTEEPRPFFPLRPGRLPHTDSYIYVKSEVLPTA